jgi:hypothetical protein
MSQGLYRQVLIATLGTQPQVVTLAVDLLVLDYVTLGGTDREIARRTSWLCRKANRWARSRIRVNAFILHPRKMVARQDLQD